MVVFQSKTLFYEVSVGPGEDPARPSFCCMDFTMDVSAPAGRGFTPVPVLCMC